MIDPDLLAYLRYASLRETPLLAENRRITEAQGLGHLQVAPEQAQLMALLVKLARARLGIEIGVLAGYSALWLAEALPPGGRLLACDIDPQVTQRARADWATAGLADRIELRIGPALTTLDAEISGGMAARYDFAFIDADKVGYIDYYERCMTLVGSGGFIMADNSLWYGRVVDADDTSTDTQAIRGFNRHLHADERVDLSLIPLGDGLTVARKR